MQIYVNIIYICEQQSERYWEILRMYKIKETNKNYPMSFRWSDASCLRIVSVYESA